MTHRENEMKGNTPLTLAIYKCEGLKNLETFGTSDPYVLAKVGTQKYKTKVIGAFNLCSI